MQGEIHPSPRRRAPDLFVGGLLALVISLPTAPTGGLEAHPLLEVGRKENKPGKPNDAAAKKRQQNEEPEGWQSLEAGLKIVRAKYVPLVVWYQAGEAGDGLQEGDGDRLASQLEEYRNTSGFSSVLKRFVRVRVRSDELEKLYPTAPKKEKKKAAKAAAKDTAPPASIGDRLRIPPGTSALLVLDFRERIRLRFDGELPRRTTLQSRMKKVLAYSLYYARQARPVEKTLETCVAEFQKGRSRVAILKVRGFESAGARRKLDPVLQARVAEVIRKFRETAEKAIAKANKLDKDGDKQPRNRFVKWDQALQAFIKISNDFPFKDIQLRANKRKGEIWTKLTFNPARGLR